jgi:glycosyltransferase involved in cell wall biosynthesis
MKRPAASVILPVHMQADHIRDVAGSFVRWLDLLALDWELLLVVNGSTDASAAECRAVARRHKGVRVLESGPGGWGRAVRLGLGAARGSMLCYTNSARTSPQDLCTALICGVMHPDRVVKANRGSRGMLRRLGSWSYNLECRWLLGSGTWDVNGTPKVFARSIMERLDLREDGDLIDAEFVALCGMRGIPLMELPLDAQSRHGGRSTTRLGTALRLYLGLPRLRARLRERG